MNKNQKYVKSRKKSFRKFKKIFQFGKNWREKKFQYQINEIIQNAKLFTKHKQSCNDNNNNIKVTYTYYKYQQ